MCSATQFGAEANTAGGVATVTTGPPELGQSLRFVETASLGTHGSQPANSAAANRLHPWTEDDGQRQWHLAMYLSDFVGCYSRFQVRPGGLHATLAEEKKKTGTSVADQNAF